MFAAVRFRLARFLPIALLALGGLVLSPAPAKADPFIGEIRLFAGNYAPYGWALCNGQLMPIAQNPALYSILGTAFGGDGSTTFALPDLRGRAPIHAGTGVGLSPRFIGQRSGAEQHVLLPHEMPQHTHAATANAYSVEGAAAVPGGNFWAKSGGGDPDYHGSADTTLNPAAVTLGNAGGGLSHNNMPPYLVLNYIICLDGLYPPRN